MNYGILGYIGGGLLSFQMIPQIIRVYRQRDASQLSLLFMLSNWVGLGCMTSYGVMNNDPPIYIPTGLSMFNTSILIFQKYFYDCSRGTTPKTEQTEEILYPEQFPLSFSPGTPPRSHPVDIRHLSQPLT